MKPHISLRRNGLTITLNGRFVASADKVPDRMKTARNLFEIYNTFGWPNGR
jgi:hypothetical protein